MELVGAPDQRAMGPLEPMGTQIKGKREPLETIWPFEPAEALDEKSVGPLPRASWPSKDIFRL